jgi:hypothetical protein
MPPGTATKAHGPSGVAATPNGDPCTETIAVRTPVRAADGAVDVAHAGDDSDRAGSGYAVGETVPAAEGLTVLAPAGADEREGAEVHPVQMIATAMAHAAEVRAFVRVGRMRA